jgi:uncharacterized LabA/DUF88 family protein
LTRFGKLALFIDGANLHATSQALGFAIDFKRLLAEFQKKGMVTRAFYYSTLGENSSVKPLLDWLNYNGFTVVSKHTNRTFAVDLAVGALQLADWVEQIVLCSGDGDFSVLVRALQRRGVRVTVVSTVSTDPPMISSDLRRQADVFLDLKSLANRIRTDQKQQL